MRTNLVVIGAGPKGLAVAVKAKVLEEFGVPVDRVTLIEKHGVAANWSGDFGYTNGEMKLGTSPEKDVVFPIEADALDSYDAAAGDPALGAKIRQRLLDFGWSSFLVQTGRFSEWIDRGRPAPCHILWATYLKWVSGQLSPQVRIVAAEVVRIGVVAAADDSAAPGHWTLALREPDGRLTSMSAERLMLTGPGRARADFLSQDQDDASLPPHAYDLESFWSSLKNKTFPATGTVAVVGAGENAAAILLALSRYAPDRQSGCRVEVISPRGFISTRAENFYENRFYSKPRESGWQDLGLADRVDFIKRTDLGVFSVHAMQILNEEVRHRIVPGRLVGLRPDGETLAVDVEYGNRTTTRRYDHVILATGFDQAATLRGLFSSAARQSIEAALGAPIETSELALRIDHDLSVRGVNPPLHLPMLAGVTQGPGFANLSCLGLLSDRILRSSLAASRRQLEVERSPRRPIQVEAMA